MAPCFGRRATDSAVGAPPGTLTTDLIDRLKANKPDLLALLSARNDPMAPGPHAMKKPRWGDELTYMPPFVSPRDPTIQWPERGSTKRKIR